MRYGNERAEEAAAELGLRNGRIISSSKSGYHRTYPDHLVVFNSTITDADGAPIWWGDIDLTTDEAKLIELARALASGLAVFYEGDSWPFVTDRKAVDMARALVRVSSTGEVEIVEGSRAHAARDSAGRLVRSAS